MSRQRWCVASVLAGVVLTGCTVSKQSAVSSPAPASGPVAGAAPAPPIPSNAFDAMVERVVDGDTFIARRGPGSPRLRVRIIGIDAPESVRPGTPPQCHGAQASAYLAGLLKERRVRAAYQLGRPQDRFGRELWDVWLPDGTFVAGQAVQLGNARALRLRPHVRHAAYLSATEAAARMSGAGLWGACPAVPSTQ